ncbi:NAD(P)-dependent oxidoreductase [Spirochaetia bacterium]|nr:NAD(P)-dependent oxidoreductase [Spirochaetia bacterium]
MIWLIGNKGMLGTELSQVLTQRGLAHIGTDREVDITNPISLENFVNEQAVAGKNITWIINCAAYTAVDKAEDDVDICRRLNTEGPANIAETAHNTGAKVLHFSTDYVFNGKGSRPYLEDDPTDPIGVYGLTKRDGEIKLFQNNKESYILRTAWLYGKHGKNFVETMLRLMNDREEIRVVNDQRGSPTWAYDLANTAADLIQQNDNTVPYGIYHFTNEGNISWFDFAKEIYTQGKALGLITHDCAVKPCTSVEYPAKVTRPAYSVLDKSKIKRTLGLSIPQWDISLKEYLKI